MLLKTSIAMFVLGLTSILFGANGVFGMPLEAGKSLLFVFLVLTVICFVGSLVLDKKL